MSSCWCSLCCLCPYCHSRENTTPGSARGVSSPWSTGHIHPAAACFYGAQKLRMLFVFLNGGKKNQKDNISWSVKMMGNLGFGVHMESFTGVPPHPFIMDCLQLLQRTDAEVRSCHRDGMAAPDSLSGALQAKFVDPCYMPSAALGKP